jgi:hypothetical protein
MGILLYWLATIAAKLLLIGLILGDLSAPIGSLPVWRALLSAFIAAVQINFAFEWMRR